MDDFMTIQQVAEKWGVSIRRVNTLCNEGRIKGAMKFGNTWAVPKNAEKPVDGRVKSGKYVKVAKHIVSVLCAFIGSLMICTLCKIEVSARDFTGVYYEMPEGSGYDISKGKNVSNFSYGQSSLVNIGLSGNVTGEKNLYGIDAYGVSDNVSFMYYPSGESFQSGNETEWNLKQINSKKVNNVTLSKKVDKGVMFVQKSSDLDNWTIDGEPSYFSSNIKNYSYSKSKSALYTTSMDDLVSGTYYRIIVAYTMERQTGTQSAISFIPITPQIPVYETIECVEIYTFYLGYNKSAVKFYDVVTGGEINNGSTVTNGFYVDKCGSNSTVTVKNGGSQYNLADKKMIRNKGSYLVTVTSEFGMQTTYSITISNGLSMLPSPIIPIVYEGEKKSYYTDTEENIVSRTVFGTEGLSRLNIAQDDSSKSIETGLHNGFNGYGLNGSNIYVLLNINSCSRIGNGWSIISDSWGKKNTELVAGVSTGEIATGAVVIQKSSDGNNWEQIDNNKYANGLYTTDFMNYYGELDDIIVYSPEGQDVIDGLYLRIYVAYEVQEDGKSSTNTRYLEKYEFYLCVSDLDAVTFHNLSITEEIIEDFTGDAEENTYDLIKRAETLTDGAGTVSGFCIDTSLNETVSITVWKNGRSVAIPSNKEFRESGKYEISIVNALGKAKSKTFYVNTESKEDLLVRYFGNSFLEGKRIYKELSYPVYEGGYTCYYISPVDDNYLPISGYIKNITTGTTIDIEATRKEQTGKLTEAGEYIAVLTTNPFDEDDIQSGDNVVFTYRFYIIAQGTAPGPKVNEASLNNYASSSINDACPVYYAVALHSATTGLIYEAFATYDAAKDFAYIYAKSQVEQLADGTFQYNGNMCVTQNEIYYSEWDITEACYYFARQAVQKRYFNIETDNTLSNDVLSETTNLCTLELTNSVVVYANESQREGLIVWDSYPVLNDKEIRYVVPGSNGYVESKTESFMFVKDENGYDSNSVIIIGPDNNEYSIEYNKSVEEQLKANNCPTGIVKIVEKTVYGDANEYKAVYYAEETNKAITTISYRSEGVDKELIVTESSGVAFDIVDAFTISSVVDEYDSCDLIIVTSPSEKQYIYTSTESITDIYVENGIYTIEISNRMGYSYSFNLSVKCEDYVRVSFEGEETEGLMDILQNIGQSNIELPILERYGYTFLGFEDENGNIYSGIIEEELYESMILYSKWEANEYNLTFKDSDGNIIDCFTVKFGYEYELPNYEVSDEYEFVGWMIGTEIVSSPFVIDIAGDIEMTAYVEGLSVTNVSSGSSILPINLVLSPENDDLVQDNNNDKIATIKIIAILGAIIFLAICIIAMILVRKSDKRQDE